MFVLALANATHAQAPPNCGKMPCIAVLSSTENCGTYGIPPAVDLVNHAARAATVTIRTNDGGHVSTGDYQIGPNTKLFLGCSGSVTNGHHVTYSIASTVWH
jgi:hypothetical protein